MLDLSNVPVNESPGRKLGSATGAGLGYVSSKVERKRQSCFNNGAIVRFRYCDISAMTLVRKHHNQDLFLLASKPVPEFSQR